MFILQLPAVNRALERCGVLCRWRTGMVLDLAQLPPRPEIPPGYRIIPWDGTRLREVAYVDWQAYRGTLDARLYWQYFSTPDGCERMWTEALAGKFGRFDPRHTLLLLRDGRVVGDVMASNRSSREGFIGNLAVAPGFRGGTGEMLLLHALWGFRESGLQRASLAVTLDNQRAYRLYTRLGFVQNGRFPLITRPRLPATPRHAPGLK